MPLGSFRVRVYLLRKYEVSLGNAILSHKWNPWIVLDKKNKSLAHGVVVEFYDEMKRSKVFDYTLKFLSSLGGGVIGPDGKWNGMVGALIRNEIDMAGPLFLDERRAKVINYAFPLAFADLVIISGVVPANKDPYLIFGIFSAEIWGLILLAVIICAGLACIIYTILPSTKEKKTTQAFFRYLWSFQISFIGKEFGSNKRWFIRHVCKSPSLKILRCTWFLTCLVLMSAYSEIITSTFAADRLKPQFEKLEDFLDYPSIKIGTYKNSYPVLCLEKLANTKLESILVRLKNDLVKIDENISSWLDNVEAGKAAFIGETMYSKFMIGERFKLTGKCNLRITKFDICSGYIAVVSRKEMPERTLKKIDKGVLKFIEGGFAKRQVLESVINYDICSESIQVVRYPLDLEDLLGAFAILVAGLDLSIFCFLMELCMGLINNII
ncbi:glutamate receptor U1 [Nephila pilipes]|uniref:Glutamate receptor U1 n=1 Tax=Nephila pilipes TaxID=299642 RepID=A0A8X6Q9V8_NEPPI|nr:glutamate receptor U1 [Nephila pilipes]